MEVEGEAARSSSLSACPLPCSLASLLTMNCRARAEGIARRLQTQLRPPDGGGRNVTENVMLVPPDWGESLTSFQEGRAYSVDDHHIDAFHKTSELNSLRPIHVVTSEPTLHLCLPQPPREFHASPDDEQDSDVHYDFDLVTPEDMTKTYSCSPPESPVTWEQDSAHIEERKTSNGEMRGAEKPESGCVTSVTSPILLSDEYDFATSSTPPLPTLDDSEDQSKFSDANLQAVREILSASSLQPLYSDPEKNCSICAKESQDQQITSSEEKNQLSDNGQQLEMASAPETLADKSNKIESISSLDENNETSTLSTKKKKSSKKKHRHKKSHSRHSTRSDSSGDSSLELQTNESLSGFQEISSPEEVFANGKKDIQRIYSRESGMFDSGESVMSPYDERCYSSSYEYCEICQREVMEAKHHKEKRKGSNGESKPKSPPKKGKSKSRRLKETKASSFAKEDPSEPMQISQNVDDASKVHEMENIESTDKTKLTSPTFEQEKEEPSHEQLNISQDNVLEEIIDDVNYHVTPLELNKIEHEVDSAFLSKQACELFPRDSDLGDSKEDTLERGQKDVLGDTGKSSSEREEPHDLQQQVVPKPHDDQADSLQDECQQQQERFSFIESWESSVNQVPHFDCGSSSFRDSDYELTTFDVHFSCLYGGSYPLCELSPSLGTMPQVEGQSKVKEREPKTLAPLSLSSGYSSQTTGSSVSFSPPVWTSDQVRIFKNESSSKDSSLASGANSLSEFQEDSFLSYKSESNRPDRSEQLEGKCLTNGSESAHPIFDHAKIDSEDGHCELQNPLEYEFSELSISKTKTSPEKTKASPVFHPNKTFGSRKDCASPKGEDINKELLSPKASHLSEKLIDIDNQVNPDNPICKFKEPFQPYQNQEGKASPLPDLKAIPPPCPSINSVCEDETLSRLSKKEAAPISLQDNHLSFPEESFSSLDKSIEANVSEKQQSDFTPELCNGQKRDIGSDSSIHIKIKDSSSRDLNDKDLSCSLNSVVSSDSTLDMKSEDTKPSGARPKTRNLCTNANNDLRDFGSEPTASNDNKIETRHIAESKIEPKVVDSTLPAGNQLNLDTESSSSDLPNSSKDEALDNDPIPTEEEEIETLAEGERNDTDEEQDDDDIEEEAILTGKFKNICKYSERVRRLSDDDDNLPPPPTEIILIDDLYEEDEEEEPEEQVAEHKEVSSSELTTELHRLEEEQALPPIEVAVEAPSDDSARSSVERDVDDDLKLRIKRSSSLKCGKTPPDTPGRKKIVRFADALGLDLAAVRTFLEGVPDVPKSAFCDLEVEEEIALSQTAPLLGPRGSFSIPASVMQNRRILTPMFQQPGSLPDFIQRVRDQKVSLENLTIGEDLSVRGIVRVMNISYHKSVSVRYTFDHWKNFHEANATYVVGSNDGFSDRFSFLLWGSFLQPNGALVFCVRFTSRGEQFWDNNKGSNYTLQCYSAPTPVDSNAQPRSLEGRPQNDTNVLQHGGGYRKDKTDTGYHSFMEAPSTPTDPWATRFF